MRDLISKHINEVHQWPATCSCCDAVLNSRAEALRHQELTEHEDVVVFATDGDMELRALEDVCTKQTVLSDGLVLCEEWSGELTR